MVTVHKYNEEREIGTMVAEIKNLKEGQDRIETKLDHFIDTADKKYATKLELVALRKESESGDNRQDKILQSRGDKIWEIVKILIPYAIIGIFYVVFKYGN